MILSPPKINIRLAIPIAIRTTFLNTVCGIKATIFLPIKEPKIPKTTSMGM